MNKKLRFLNFIVVLSLTVLILWLYTYAKLDEPGSTEMKTTIKYVACVDLTSPTNQCNNGDLPIEGFVIQWDTITIVTNSYGVAYVNVMENGEDPSTAMSSVISVEGVIYNCDPPIPALFELDEVNRYIEIDFPINQESCTAK